MRMDKKRILKEDGRYLLYYHFPDSATPEQTEAFEAVPAPVIVSGEAEANTDADAPRAGKERESRV